jgi:hypothetical protein
MGIFSASGSNSIGVMAYSSNDKGRLQEHMSHVRYVRLVGEYAHLMGFSIILRTLRCLFADQQLSCCFI